MNHIKNKGNKYSELNQLLITSSNHAAVLSFEAVCIVSTCMMGVLYSGM